MGEPDECRRIHGDRCLLSCFAGRSGCRSGQFVGRPVIADDLVRSIDLPAGKDPHATEGDLGVLAEHEGLDARVSVAQHNHGGCRD